MSPFSGFPADTLPFLSDLAENNQQDWFLANKTRYQAALVAPGKAFVEAMGPALQELDPDLNAVPKVNGSIFRINRDIRFAADKRPYKEEAGFRFWHGPDRKANVSGLMMRIKPGFVGLAAGIWAFDKDVRAAFREAVADDARGTVLAEAIANLGVNGCTFTAPKLKRVPKPWTQDHPRADLLKLNGLVVGIDIAPAPDALHGPEFVGWCADQFEQMLPVHEWLLALTD